jgi:hypothetical protein
MKQTFVQSVFGDQGKRAAARTITACNAVRTRLRRRIVQRKNPAGERFFRHGVMPGEKRLGFAIEAFWVIKPRL